ncbi:glycosyltransferase [Photobacterium sanctipauli]|nr:glycosyltransferase [Photobacterium sanctipauli]
MNNAKIGLFIPSMKGGGAEKVFVNLANYLISENFEVCLILKDKIGPNLNFLDDRVKVIPLDSTKMLYAPFLLARTLKENKISHLMSTVRGANIIVGLSRFLYNEYNWTLREANTFTNAKHNNGYKSRLIDLLCKLIYPKAEKILANSPDTKNDILFLNRRINTNSVKVLPNPVLSDIPKLNKKDSKNVKQIIAIGRLELQKDYELMLQSVYHLKAIYSNFKLKIYGEGSFESKLKALASDLNIESHIEFCGYSDKVKLDLLNSDLFVLTSKWEGFGNVLVEALSCGIPIVSSLCPGGPSYILKESDYIKLIDSRDPELYSSAYKEMICNGITYCERVKLQRMSFDYLTSNVCKNYLDLILK